MVIGAWLYLLLIEFHWPPVEEVLDEPPRDYTEEADNKINRHPMKDMSNVGELSRIYLPHKGTEQVAVYFSSKQ